MPPLKRKKQVCIKHRPTILLPLASNVTCTLLPEVVITVSKHGKHSMPVDPTPIDDKQNYLTRQKQNNVQPWSAMANRRRTTLICGVAWKRRCNINGYRPQLVVMRDPRPMAVSAYCQYHRVRLGAVRTGVDKEWYIMALPLTFVSEAHTVHRDHAHAIHAVLVQRHSGGRNRTTFTSTGMNRRIFTSQILWYNRPYVQP